MKTTLIIKQQGALRFKLLYDLVSSSALIACTVMYHCCNLKIVLVAKSCHLGFYEQSSGWLGSGCSLLWFPGPAPGSSCDSFPHWGEGLRWPPGE